MEREYIVDIHSHIIPAVDDGSESMEMTISLINRACSQGATAFFATSHSDAFYRTGENVLHRYQNMREQLHALFPHVDIFIGCEVLCSKETISQIGQDLRTGVLPSMNNTRYVLIEYCQDEEWDTIQFCVSALLLQNWIPIIAHAERYKALCNNPDRICWLRETGCRIQLNIYSLESIQPDAVRDWARRMILENYVDFLGTDMHSYWVRTPSITQGMQWLEENCPHGYLEKITWKNAEDMLIKG